MTPKYPSKRHYPPGDASAEDTHVEHLQLDEPDEIEVGFRIVPDTKNRKEHFCDTLVAGIVAGLIVAFVAYLLLR